jgi:hypothetical protein
MALQPPASLTTLRAGKIASLSGIRTGTVEEEIALSEAALRQDVAATIVRTFIKVNGVVLAIVAVTFASDCALLFLGKIAPADRIVSTNLLIALISATTVQLGSIALSMGKYVFPANTDAPRSALLPPARPETPSPQSSGLQD